LKKVEFFVMKTREPRDRADLKRIWCETAVNTGCNKVAIPDSLDFLDSAIFAAMSGKGVFTCPGICEEIHLRDKSPMVTLVRPLCLLTDQEIEENGMRSRYPNRPTGIGVPEEPSITCARRAFARLLGAATNIRLNFFLSQFQISPKFVGAGEDDGSPVGHEL
jgi:hypothetical protein